LLQRFAHFSHHAQKMKLPVTVQDLLPVQDQLRILNLQDVVPIIQYSTILILHLSKLDLLLLIVQEVHLLEKIQLLMVKHTQYQDQQRTIKRQLAIQEKMVQKYIFTLRYLQNPLNYLFWMNPKL
jgi:hypothetical protein